MSDSLKIYLAQIDTIVGAIDKNVARITAVRETAAQEGANLVVFPELCLSGYPPEDLVLRDDFMDYVAQGAEELARITADGGPAILIGAPWKGEHGARHNAALLLHDGEIAAVRFKHHLPNYGIFDEARVFEPGPYPEEPVEFGAVKLGVVICEDMWFPNCTRQLKESGADILIVMNASPFETGKPDLRQSRAESRVRETGLPLLYLNLIGGQDEVVFDGSSFVMSRFGRVVLRMPSWQEKCLMTVWEPEDGGWRCHDQPIDPTMGRRENIWRALMTGLRSYVEKNNFPGVLLGLSGGIDSAITTAVAVDALGADRVWCVMMPSPYTAQESIEDAAEVARLCRVRLDTIPISPMMERYNSALAPIFEDRPHDLTEENIQARIRGTILMALSNKFGHMLLSTSNKSEASVGYATLYGDMCGGYSVIKDLYKTKIFLLSRWRNKHYPDGLLGPAGLVMPERVITKPPSAELRPNQTDQDSLPPYDVLDAILEGLIESGRSVADLVNDGHEEAVVRAVRRMLDRAEYKRRQAPPGIKISTLAFGRDRRYPITNGSTELI